ncbi:MAG: NUDIX domain-containing protein [Jatrophihabitans sp.]
MTRTVAGPTDKKPKNLRDDSGRTLQDYPRPSVAVDAALLTVINGDDGEATLGVLEVKRDGAPGWRLPGTILHEGERLIEAVLRCLQDKAGVTGLNPRQLHVFDDPQRDDRGWVLSVAHVDAGPVERLAGRLEQTRIAHAGAPGRLPYGHGVIVERAVEDLRRRYAAAPDPDRMLAESFTLRELRVVHEAVAGQEFQRDTFRRAMEPLLRATGRVAVGGRGRPAELFARV